LIKRIRLPRIFFGWWINIVTGILTGLGSGFTYQGSSVFFKSIASDLSLSRAATSVASGIGAVQNNVMFALTGWLSDRFGPKWPIIAGICLSGIGLVLMNFINSPWGYYIVWGVIIVSGNSLGFTIAIDKMLTSWFVRKRGLAFGIRFALIGILESLLLPLISWLSVTQGWRMSCLIWAGVVFACAPVALYFVRPKRPEYYGLLPDGAKVESSSEAGEDAMIAKGVEYAADFQETEFTFRQAIRTLAYRLLAVVWIIQMVSWGFYVHIIPFLTDRGIDPVAAGSMMAMMVFFTIPSTFLGGIIADHVRKDRLNFLLAGAFLLMAIGITVFVLRQTIVMIYIFFILWGFGSGVLTPVTIVIISRYFGRKAYGSIQGSIAILSAPISLLAPIYTGWVYDTTGSYTTAFILFAALAACGALLMCLVRPPKPPVQRI
jgi:MFS family permease